MAERFGLGSMLNFSRANILPSYYRLGMWDEVMTRVDELLDGSPPVGTEAAARTVRALIRVGRGDLAGAREDSAFGLARARQAQEPQAMFPSLSIHAYVLHSAGDDDDARTLVREILERLVTAGPVLLFAASAEMITTWLELVGQNRLKALLESHRAETKWLTAARAIAEGALDQALELYHEVESLPDVALMHLATLPRCPGRRPSI